MSVPSEICKIGDHAKELPRPRWPLFLGGQEYVVTPYDPIEVEAREAHEFLECELRTIARVVGLSAAEIIRIMAGDDWQQANRCARLEFSPRRCRP